MWNTKLYLSRWQFLFVSFFPSDCFFFLSSALPASSAACTHYLSIPHTHTHARARSCTHAHTFRISHLWIVLHKNCHFEKKKKKKKNHTRVFCVHVQFVGSSESAEICLCEKGFRGGICDNCMLVNRPWQKKRALKFALKGSESFKACFELYQCLNPEKSFKSSFKNDFWAFFCDFCSTMFWVVAWVQVEFRSLSSFRRCMLFDWLLLLLLLSKFTFSRDCAQGSWVSRSKVCFSTMADCTSAKSHPSNRALKCYKSFKTEL